MIAKWLFMIACVQASPADRFHNGANVQGSFHGDAFDPNGADGVGTQGECQLLHPVAVYYPLHRGARKANASCCILRPCTTPCPEGHTRQMPAAAHCGLVLPRSQRGTLHPVALYYPLPTALMLPRPHRLE